MERETAVAGHFDTIGDLMNAAADQIGEHEAIVDGDRRITFAEWIRAADGVARCFHDAGVARGDIVALHLGNGIEYAVAYAAAARLGAIATGINLRLGPNEVQSIIERTAPKVYVTDPGAASPPGLADTTILDAHAIRRAAEGPALERHGDGVGTDPVCIIWTSGTTGVPKGAWFDHRNLEAAVASGGAMTNAFDRRLASAPFAHAGYMAKLWEHIAMGITLVISPTPWTAESMLATIVDERITVAAGVPTQWAKLLELPEVRTADFSVLRIGLAATAPATPDLIEHVAATLGCPLVVRYAMTESPSISGTEPTDPPEVQARTVGRAQRGMEIRVVDGDQEPVPNGAIGRVRVRGGCVMRGYWRDPVRTAEVLSDDGWLTSSDLGAFDPHGNLVLSGRIDDMYIRGGFNVYPIEVENALADHPAIAQVAVVGLPTAVIGEIGVAVVVPADPERPPLLADIRAWVGERVADYKRPDELIVVDHLPVTAMMKIDKIATRELAAARLR